MSSINAVYYSTFPRFSIIGIIFKVIIIGKINIITIIAFLASSSMKLLFGKNQMYGKLFKPKIDMWLKSLFNYDQRIWV